MNNVTIFSFSSSSIYTLLLLAAFEPSLGTKVIKSKVKGQINVVKKLFHSRQGKYLAFIYAYDLHIY